MKLPLRESPVSQMKASWLEVYKKKQWALIKRIPGVRDTGDYRLPGVPDTGDSRHPGVRDNGDSRLPSPRCQGVVLKLELLREKSLRLKMALSNL